MRKLFDFNNDGQVDISEEYLAFRIWEDINDIDEEEELLDLLDEDDEDDL